MFLQKNIDRNIGKLQDLFLSLFPWLDLLSVKILANHSHGSGVVWVPRQIWGTVWWHRWEIFCHLQKVKSESISRAVTSLTQSTSIQPHPNNSSSNLYFGHRLKNPGKASSQLHYCSIAISRFLLRLQDVTLLCVTNQDTLFFWNMGQNITTGFWEVSPNAV